MPVQTHVIVGASLAGASAAIALRKGGFDGRVVLIGDESDLPYERPELSKKYLRGDLDAPPAVQAAAAYESAGIELKLDTRVTAIDVAASKIRTADGVIPYDRLLIATGSQPRRLAIPGGDLDGVMTLRTRTDADDLHARAMAARSIVVIGGGWIGSEVAATLRELGRDVTLVFPTRTPLERVMGPEVGAVYGDVHAEHGVRLRPGATAVGLRGSASGSVTGVVLDDGTELTGDLVVVGIGATPRTELAATAGIDVGDGILVDEHLETGVGGVFAAGDVANAPSTRFGRRLRVEHWDNAKRQGRVAAANMLGNATAYDRIPYFFSDQFELGMEYTGHARDWDEVVIRGDRAARAFIAFWLKDGVVLAGMNVNTWDARPAIEKLVARGAAVDRAALADPSRPLDELAEAAGTAGAAQSGVEHDPTREPSLAR